MLEQYGRRNNIEITGIPDTVEDNELENNVIVIFDAISVEAKSANFEDCYRVGKSKITLKRSKQDLLIEESLKMLSTKRNN